MTMTQHVISVDNTKEPPSLKEMADALQINVEIYEQGVKTLAEDGYHPSPDSYHAGVVSNTAIIVTLFPEANIKGMNKECKESILQGVSKAVHSEIIAIKKLPEQPPNTEMLDALRANVEIYESGYPSSHHAGVMGDTAIIITLIPAESIKDMDVENKDYILQGASEAVDERLPNPVVDTKDWKPNHERWNDLRGKS